MGLFEGKKGLILGVANDHSLAWAIAQQVMAEGAVCGFSHLPDRADDERQRNRRRVSQLTDATPSAKFLVPLDVSKDADIAGVMEETKKTFGKIDFLLHSIAHASLEDLKRDTVETSRNGFLMAMEISVYSLIATVNAARPILNDGAAIVTMTYFGGEKCVPGYNVMGICKAALDSPSNIWPSISARAAFASMPSVPDRSARWPVAGRGSTKCCRCTKRWLRWAAT